MSQMPGASQSNVLESPAQDRLMAYCNHRFGDSSQLTKLIGDASTRQYFRVQHGNDSYIAAVYPESIDPETHPYCDVTELFAVAGIPVPKIIDTNGAEGIILQEDLGDLRLQDRFGAAAENEIRKAYQRAIDIIIQIQGATFLAYERESVASELAFDEGRLFWELQFFFKHFTAVSNQKLSEAEESQVLADLTTIARELSARPRLLTHRDYHSRNLMLSPNDDLYVIDYQDARMGPFSYDLASLLNDPYATISDALIAQLYNYYVVSFRTAVLSGDICLAREVVASEDRQFVEFDTLMPENFDATDFRQEFELMTLQRMLKAIGTYTYQQGACGNDVYVVYIEPAMKSARQSLRALDRFPTLAAFLG
jgi:aminoglycoside/choline kinase family phosphotransferase